MKRVYKYHLPFELDVITIKMPKDAEILSVGNQNEAAYLWALVDSNAELIDYHFRMAGTGHPIIGGDIYRFRFIGTVHFQNSTLIFHIFEMTEK